MTDLLWRPKSKMTDWVFGRSNSRVFHPSRNRDKRVHSRRRRNISIPDFIGLLFLDGLQRRRLLDSIVFLHFTFSSFRRRIRDKDRILDAHVPGLFLSNQSVAYLKVVLPGDLLQVLVLWTFTRTTSLRDPDVLGRDRCESTNGSSDGSSVISSEVMS